MKFKLEMKKQQRLREVNRYDTKYQTVMWIRDKFRETGLDIADTFSWRLINDYLLYKEFDAVTKGQNSKVAELILKYGPDSDFWDWLIRTAKRREKDLNRVMVLVRTIQARGCKFKEKDLSGMLKASFNFRKQLLVIPLSRKQYNWIYKVERMVGIYYDDLSPEENGIVGGTKNV